MIEWGSPDWGKAGLNIHESETGSWLPDWRDSGKGDPS